jgi:hypothetical protein
MTDEQLTKLRESETAEEMEKFAESLPKFVRGAEKPSLPSSGNAGDVDYATLREELAEEYSFTQ